MKIKGILFATLSLLGISGVFAQSVEFDDLYFNRNDRAKLKAQRGTEVSYNKRDKSRMSDYEAAENVNPTDSYSARNVNPEFTSRAHTEAAQVDDEDYFVNNYQYNRNQFNNWNQDFNRWNNNPWYRSNYYGPGINSWNSPYYGYDRWSSPWVDPFWSYNGYSSAFSHHYGNSWNYGWGGNYNYWNRPYYGYNSSFGNGFGYAGGYGGGYWNNYRNPGTVVIINNQDQNGRGIAYGKRPTRGNTIVSDRSDTRSRSNVVNSVREDNNNNPGGRIRTQSGRQDDYYNRNQNNSNNTSPSDTRSNTQNNRSRSWDNNDNFNNGSSNRSSSPSYTPSRSSSSDGGGTRTNSSSGSSGGRGRD